MSGLGRYGSSPKTAYRASNRSRRRNLIDLRPLVKGGRYRLGKHACMHAASEGFTEPDIVRTVLYGRELVSYWEDERLLVLGYIPAGPTVKIPLHVVLEYSKPKWVDVVTAFIPRDPHRTMSSERLAEVLRYDQHSVRTTVMGERYSRRVRRG